MDMLFGVLEIALWFWCITPEKRRAVPRSEPDRWTPPEQWEVNRVVGGGTALPPDRGDPLYDRQIDG